MATAGSKVIEKMKVREVAGIFPSRDELVPAIDVLLLAGFDRADIDVIVGRQLAIYGIQPLRDDALEPKRAGMPAKFGALADLVVDVADCVLAALEEGSETRLAVRQRQRHQIEAVDVKSVLRGDRACRADLQSVHRGFRNCRSQSRKGID
jgi:hypothetical protein